jgi:hypothetical protein
MLSLIGDALMSVCISLLLAERVSHVGGIHGNQ